MKIKKSFIFLITIYISTVHLFAAPQSCRDAMKISNEYLKNDYYDTELFLLIDQSTYFNSEDKKIILQKITPFIKENTRINIYGFTEYSKSRKNKDLGSFYIYSDVTADEEDDVSRSKVKNLAQCLKKAKLYAYEGLKKGLDEGIRKKGDNIQKSEILRNLSIYSKSNIKYSKAKRKIVIIMSDMLENSKHISFYKNGKVKELDIDKELNIVKKRRYLSYFNGAEIHVYGLGKVEVNSTKEDIRDIDILDSLANFWVEYFELSNGKPSDLRSYNMDYNLE
ncbi:hypothetical protein ACMC56_00755 [Campylobacterota bacterium DY0563]